MVFTEDCLNSGPAQATKKEASRALGPGPLPDGKRSPAPVVGVVPMICTVLPVLRGESAWPQRRHLKPVLCELVSDAHT